jgi:hypothetical protein
MYPSWRNIFDSLNGGEKAGNQNVGFIFQIDVICNSRGLYQFILLSSE